MGAGMRSRHASVQQSQRECCCSSPTHTERRQPTPTQSGCEGPQTHERGEETRQCKKGQTPRTHTADGCVCSLLTAATQPTLEQVLVHLTAVLLGDEHGCCCVSVEAAGVLAAVGESPRVSFKELTRLPCMCLRQLNAKGRQQHARCFMADRQKLDGQQEPPPATPTAGFL